MNSTTDEADTSRAAAAGDGAAGAPQHDAVPGRSLEPQDKLDNLEIERIVQYQRERSLAFGSPAAQRLSVRPDALGALGQLLHPPYVPSPGAYSGDPELVVVAAPFSEQAEVFRELRTQLLAKALARRSRAALAVVSPRRGEGKTHVAANLAASLAQLGGRTLLIDADLRSPRLHRLLRTGQGEGLSSLLGGRHAPPAPLLPLPEVPGLHFIPAGTAPSHPVELLQSPRFSLLLYEMLSRFDHVVVDTPADAWGADARLVAAKAGAALVVGRKDHSPLSDLHVLLSRLANGPAEIAGVVMNRH